jgi:hypothetical protein
LAWKIELCLRESRLQDALVIARAYGLRSLEAAVRARIRADEMLANQLSLWAEDA